MTRIRLKANGRFDVTDGRRRCFQEAVAQVTYRTLSGTVCAVRTARQENSSTLRGEDENIAVLLRAEDDTLELSAAQCGNVPILLDEMSVLDCDTAQGGKLGWGNASELMYLHHGWQSWSPTGVRRLTAPEIPYPGDNFFEKHLPYGAAAAHERTSNGFMILGRAGDRDAVRLGFESGAHHLSQILCELAGDQVTRVRAVAHGDGRLFEPGDKTQVEPFSIQLGNVGALYDQYAERVARRMGRRDGTRPLDGWCTWYYYYGENTIEDVRANLDAICAQGLPLDLVIIDDGYQTAIGDWTTIRADKFPNGMKAAADEIHAAGKRAGIWLAPFGAREDSQLAHAHPEFILKDQRGAPVIAWNHWGARVYALDLTQPGVHQWLRALFHTVCREWGYDAVKLDFVFAGALAGQHFDPKVTRAEAYRRGLQVIGGAVGADTLLLGCGAPILPSVGLTDTMRVSQDVHFTWEPGDRGNGGAVSTRHAVQNTIARAPLNQRWWLNDPDCVIVRARNDLNVMTRNENRTLASVAALTGSLLLDGDNLAGIRAAYLDDLRRALPALDKTATVREWFSATDEQPSQLALEFEDGRWILAIVRWDRRTGVTNLGLPTGKPYHVYNFWAGQYLGVRRGQVQLVQHAPHQTVVLHCAPVGERAGVIASSFHIAASDIRTVKRSADSLELGMAHPAGGRGQVLIHAPLRKRNVRATLNGRPVKLASYGRGVFGVRFRAAPTSELRFTWS